MRTIHEFIMETWELHESPIAYVRTGDPGTLIKDFTDAAFDVREHPFGYRSIHYLLKSKPAKSIRLAELQVRTIFEEGWSEIDHRIRYPRHSDDPYLAQFLTIFNRLAGSADEMGTFIKALASHVLAQAEKMAEQDHEIKKKEAALQKAVSELKITTGEKNKLKQQISELGSSSPTNPYLAVAPRTMGDLMNNVDWGTYAKKLAINYESILGTETVCSNCGKTFVRFISVAGVNNLCPICQASQFGSVVFTPPTLPK